MSGIQSFTDAGFNGSGLVFSLYNGAEVTLQLSIDLPEVGTAVESEDGYRYGTQRIERGEEMLKVGEAAEELGITLSSIRHYIFDGRLPTLKPGHELRIMRSDLEKLRQEIEEPELKEPPKGAMNVHECAEWLRYTPGHVRKLASQYGMPAYRVGVRGDLYFKKDEVLKWMRERSKR